MKKDLDSSLGAVTFRAIALIGGKSVQELLLSLLFIWLARTDQAGYGTVLFAISIVALLRSIQSLGIDQFTLRELSTCRTTPKQFLRQMALIKIIIGLSFFLFFLLFALFRNWPSNLTAVLCSLIIGQVLEGIADTFFNIFRAEGKSINESLCRTAPNLLSAVYGSACLLFGLGIISFSLLFVLSGFLKVCMAFLGTRKLEETTLSKQAKPFPLRKALSKSFFIFSTASFLGIFYNEIQVFWIKQYHTLIDIAVYRSAFDIAAFVCGIVANLVIGAVIFPLLTTAFSEGNREKIHGLIQFYFKKIIAVGSGVAFILAVFGGKIVYLIYGQKYLAAVPLAPIFGIAALFSFINNFIIHIMLATQKEKQLALILIVPVAISLTMGPLLIPTHGPIGAAISLLLTRAVFSIVLITSAQTRFRFLMAIDYKNVAVGWLVALTVLGGLVFLQVDFFLSCALAICLYYTVAWLGRHGSWTLS